MPRKLRAHAVLSAPDLIKPSEWMPIVLGDAEPVFEDMSGLNESIFAGEAVLPAWAQGFIFGHQWLEESWEAALPEALGEE